MTDDDGVERRTVLKAGGAAAALGIGGGGFMESLTQRDDVASKGTPGVESFVGQDEVVQTICAPNCRGSVRSTCTNETAESRRFNRTFPQTSGTSVAASSDYHTRSESTTPPGSSTR
ncbi:hypothetical protein VB779_03570 [Haloarculaceae archaeon H-GB11]|nr:hypothetical protein [Haloarculaceae archaeon H-GB11]